LAHIILNIQPYCNTTIPPTTKYINQSSAKIDYRVGLREFKEAFAEYGGIEFKKKLYMRKEDFDSKFGLAAFSKDMPKVGFLINEAKDKSYMPSWCATQDFSKEVEERDGKRVVTDKYITTYSTEEEINQKYKLLYENCFEVSKLLGIDKFEAISVKNGEKRVFSCQESDWFYTPLDNMGTKMMGYHLKKRIKEVEAGLNGYM